jgi:hypothetical protein
MKKVIALAAVATFAAGAAFAGGMDAPAVEPMVDVVPTMDEPAGGSNWVIPVIALLLIGAAVAVSESE